MTAAAVLFSRKLDVMNEEFDTYMGALVADLIYKQHILRDQTRKNLERVDKSAKSELTQVLVEDLRRTEHLVYVDTALNMTEENAQAIRD